ncbi:monooxygenase [Aquimarina mytili]|uniref:Monooxygenase n=1 Tax=Aquimarina mytili TaxID=874423 RepID=A0A937DAK8_9FLAO|nr:monooxygenase [Aquimarina mytili]MBL0686110.1 monooxygenase [Aquimarina mytili]
MSTQKIWDLHLKYDGPVTQEFMDGNKQLAASIAEEEGIIWKIWTYEEGTNHYGSTYLFKNLDYLEKYREMHVKRLNAIGITDITDYIFDIFEDLSKIDNAPIG